jgi:hypothetical protein
MHENYGAEELISRPVRVRYLFPGTGTFYQEVALRVFRIIGTGHLCSAQC